MEAKQKIAVQPDPQTIKKDIMQLILAYENGLSEAELSRTMAETSSILRMNAINALTNEGKVQLCKRGSELIYRAMDSRSAGNLSVFSNASVSIEERAVYRVIEESGNKGIWNKDIRTQTKLPLTQLSKVLKNLETKKLIKAVKSVAASKRKVYMLYDVEPDKSVTGGAWYSETEFDSSFVTVLQEQCLQYIKKQLDEVNQKNAAASTTVLISDRDSSLISSIEVKRHIDHSKISNVSLSLQDIEMVLETIVFDGLIEKITIPKTHDASSTTLSNESRSNYSQDVKMEAISDDELDEASVNYYRAIREPTVAASVMRIPCGQCPHIDECRPGAVISPDKCLYLERWFET